MSEKKIFLVMDEQEQKHDQPWPSYHIETPQRLEAIKYQLDKARVLYNSERISHIPRRTAYADELLLVHTERYLNDVKSTEMMTEEQQEAFCTKYEDIYVNYATWQRAKFAAGSAIDLVTSVVNHGTSGIAFIRPPGHHAMPDAGCGFCILNNVAIAAKHAVKSGLAKRVMIVDYDVHAANGTQECIETGDDDIRLISIHRYENGTFWPNMPQTGMYHNYHNTMNIPLNAIGLTDSDYLALFTQIVIPEIFSYKPELIIVSSGFDASLGDPEGYMNVTPAGFATMIRMLTNTKIPVAAVLEGGYFLEALASSSEWVVKAMLGENIPRIKAEKIHPTIVDTILKIQEKRLETSGFYRKIREFREILGSTMLATTEEHETQTDYKGERTVKAPYETRGIYTPFSEEKVDDFLDQLDDLLESYEDIDYLYDIRDRVERSENDNLIAYVNGDLVVGDKAKFFAELVLLAPVHSNAIVALPMRKLPNFDEIQLDSSLKELKINAIFNNLPIFQL